MDNQTISTPHAAQTGRRKTIFIGGVVLLVLALVWFVRSTQTRSAESSREAGEQEHEEKHDTSTVELPADAQKNAQLSILPAETRAVSEVIHATGSVGPDETRVAHVRAIARGRIQKVHVRLGDRVRRGQALAVYDNIELGELIGEYAVGLAALKKAQSEAEVTKRSMERARSLVDLGAVAKAEYERRSGEYASALSAIETQRAELARTEEKLHRFGMDDDDIRSLDKPGAGERHREASQASLRSPFAGVITAYDIAEGEMVETDKELFTIVDLSTVWVQANIFEKDIAAVRKGQPVKIHVDAYPDQTFTGTITYVGDFLDPKTRSAKVRCEVANSDYRLKLDMFATIELPSPKGREAVMIPSSAIQLIDNKPVAFVKTGEVQFQRRDLQLGTRAEDWVEVKEGIRAGEPVVSAGSFTLKSVLLREQIGDEH